MITDKTVYANAIDYELSPDVDPDNQYWHVFALPGDDPMGGNESYPKLFTDSNCSPLTNNPFDSEGYYSDG